LLMLTDVAVGIHGACLGIFFVRCPQCHKHWVRAALRGQTAGGWLGWLLNQRNCPACRFPDAVSRPQHAEPSAPPNGGPAERLDSSRVSGGPPSVS
jgi:hypothetical protein